ncbi:hypothetical protein OI25_7596 [Paraburkholderia fungorum]|jgi:hypothetical protein|uniref:Uncharacterized protein n=1 Tax=Paraburkholderia fungorum TaxID=134537 RepID=A0AAU8T9K3_9BURK|nr:hypothetical protein OI25_7596 [Paraburkholderia fungorum]
MAVRTDIRTQVLNQDNITAKLRRTRWTELEGLRGTPESIRRAEGERLCVVETEGDK